MAIVLKPVPLTPEVFAPYGDVMSEASARELRNINYGYTERFHDLARLDLTASGGVPLVSLFRSTPLPRPIAVKVMERHPLSSQAFFPLEGRPYLVVVAARGDFKVENLCAFVAAPRQGVNYHAGVWHHFSLALDAPSDFLVIDRGGSEKNCDEVFLDTENITVDY
ncbi:MAG: ureidoglycolate lyase [Alphaproteobacteria bacterium]|nr:ureidoglycolate lyase [Alphaproteobacteria bacterium]